MMINDPNFQGQQQTRLRKMEVLVGLEFIHIRDKGSLEFMYNLHKYRL